VKILDKYILKTFLITFTSVFVILFFIFVLQTVWLFISELAGRDLDFILVAKFLMYSMPGIIPLVLPLSVLLSSIMTFGDLAENYEFAAMKSSGVSLQRAIKYLVFFMIGLSIATFFFANNVIPYSQYKLSNFRRNIAQVKPTMAIVEGRFSEIGDYTIKVDKKSGAKENILTGIVIHKKPISGTTNSIVIKAKNGELLSSEKSNILQLIMYDGDQYEDIAQNHDYGKKNTAPFSKTEFKKYIVKMDLSKLNNVDMNANQISTKCLRLMTYDTR
jgi:lipopolysaccharide export system permease protein